MMMIQGKNVSFEIRDFELNKKIEKVEYENGHQVISIRLIIKQVLKNVLYKQDFCGIIKKKQCNY